jgi:UDP-sulfoquinovose synthase
MVDFRACGQSLQVKKGLSDDSETYILAKCKRRPQLGIYDPTTVTFADCPEWIESPYGYLLKDMRIMILGIDGYLGWTLALWLGSLGLKISGIDNYNRRNWVKERGAHTIVPIARMTGRLHAAMEVLGIDINFREIDILDRARLSEFIDEVKPEAIVHYAECPSAPYSMIDADHAIMVQQNNVLGTLGLLFIMRDIVPETSLIKLGTMGEYGTPLTGRPLFEGVFPADAILKWDNREWSLAGRLHRVILSVFIM